MDVLDALDPDLVPSLSHLHFARKRSDTAAAQTFCCEAASALSGIKVCASKPYFIFQVFQDILNGFYYMFGTQIKKDARISC